jgi:uncharacterized membrane protein YhfC
LKALSLFLTFIGGLAIALGLQWLAQRSAALNVTVFTQSALCLWLSATILYNRCWARQLAAGQTAALAKMTIWAGIVAVAIAGVFREQYRFLIPLAFFSYSLFNLIGVFLFHRSELRDAFGYVLATALGFCSGVFIFISF